MKIISSTKNINETYERFAAEAKKIILFYRIRPEHDDLGRALAEMVRVHQFDKLIFTTQEALKENADG